MPIRVVVSDLWNDRVLDQEPTYSTRSRAMAEVQFSTLGWFYIGLTAAITVLLLWGMVFLHRHRRLPFLQIRRLPVVFAAVINLHLYAAVCMTGYTIGPVVPCDAQFWVMSIYLPLGMALLQAANSQFLYVASQQRKFARFNNLEDYTTFEKCRPVDTSLPWWKQQIDRVKRMDKMTRVLVYIGIGMTIELILTLIVYFGSEMFHPSYGFFNVKVPGTEQQRATLCFQGWEWWLSIAWQFFWAWIYAPYMLWKTRNIHDTHGWRITTIWCCIAGLPASPLWLAGLYSPAFTPVNMKMIPPQWFSISIFLIEIAVIGFPCLQVIKTHNLKQETLDAIAAWEKRQQGGNVNPEKISTKSSGFTSTLAGSFITGKSGKSNASSTASRDSTLTMAALENVLKNNPQPLLEFAALKDFSGENISFLSHVSDWKRSCALSKDEPGDRYEQFISAVRIYSHFVSLEYSEFPVNISSRTGKALHQTFDKAARELNSRRTSNNASATPFGDAPTDSSTADLHAQGGMELEDTLGKANLQSVTRMAVLASDGQIDAVIPAGFGPEAFDDAEKEIKYLVLTNTWPKFVHAGFESASQAEKKDEKHMLDGVRQYLCGIERIA
ncbi:hypothetical protein JX265_000473 [Neoarthrinium moseri]|uniref:RGS domain-containing protein n=1 Tax=Neoarthrinium moseri TaxID=1658444 RepID=A0A9P9WYL4_9PEZI|nr:hypothetical protein JX265_000473 [Neoarthrinium moseri]